MSNHPAWVAAGTVIGVMAVGVISLWRGRSGFERQREFATEYLQHLQSYIRSRGDDHLAYAWMTQRSERMQVQLGSAGILDYYQRPFSQVAIRNVPVILNVLPELRLWLSSSILRSGSDQFASMLQEILIRHAGLLDDGIADRRKQLFNPVVWLREGTAAVLLAPFTLLAELGVLGRGTPSRVASSAVFRVSSGVSSLVGFIAAIATIISSWEDLARIVSKMIND